MECAYKWYRLLQIMTLRPNSDCSGNLIKPIQFNMPFISHRPKTFPHLACVGNTALKKNEFVAYRLTVSTKLLNFSWESAIKWFEQQACEQTGICANPCKNRATNQVLVLSSKMAPSDWISEHTQYACVSAALKQHPEAVAVRKNVHGNLVPLKRSSWRVYTKKTWWLRFIQ